LPKVYLSGPITSDPDGFEQHFAHAANYFRNSGWVVTNPALPSNCPEELGDGTEFVWSEEAWVAYLTNDVRELAKGGYTHIALLNGWQQSSGALVELGVASKLGLKVLLESEDFATEHTVAEVLFG
jgi:hypothetical protein